MADPITPPALPSVQRIKDEEHLRLLVIFHYIVAGLGALFACFPLIHVAIGLMFLFLPAGASARHGEVPPPWFGLIFVVIGGLFVLFGWSVAICTFISGRYLAKRRKRMFSFVISIVLCLFMPFGTVLGVFTLIVLGRESVQQLYLEKENGSGV